MSPSYTTTNVQFHVQGGGQQQVVDAQQPGGAVDRTWNIDNHNLNSSPNTIRFPGADLEVDAVAVQTNNGRTRLLPGSLMPSIRPKPLPCGAHLAQRFYPTFDPGSGADDSVLAMAVDAAAESSLEAISASFNNQPGHIYRIARLNPNGSVDASFNTGAGANAACARDHFRCQR